MAKNLKPELSLKNEFRLDKHRYYELKHFCMQYKTWKEALRRLSYLDSTGILSTSNKSNSIVRPVERIAERKLYFARKIQDLEDSLMKCDPLLRDYILKAVTEDRSYEFLRTKLNIPCCRNSYYKEYRRFFWFLDNTRKIHTSL